MDESMLRNLEDCLKLDMPVSKAVQICGITEKTFYTWIKEDERVAQRMRTAKAFATQLARRSVINQMATDGALALKYLERKEKDEFSTKNIVKTEAATSELDPDEKEELKKLFQQNNIKVPGFDENGEFEDELG